MSSKDIVLGFIEQNKDRYISGQDMADTLGYSRNAVWKAITDLRSKGYEIDAVKNRGYRLSPKSDILSVQGISSFLDFEPQIHIYDSLASTNRTVLSLKVYMACPTAFTVADAGIATLIKAKSHSPP